MIAGNEPNEPLGKEGRNRKQQANYEQNDRQLV